MKKIVGKVTPEERDEILALFERKNGLNELALLLNSSSDQELYEKLVMDLGETSLRFQRWWDTKAKQYCWESVKGGNWEIDFDTCEIFLLTPE